MQATVEDAAPSGGVPEGWIALCHVARVARPGDVCPLDPWGVALLAVRDRDGQVGVFRNVCSHRGRRLVARAAHLPGMMIRCPAHQWLYGLDGRLHSAPRYGPGKPGRADQFDWEGNGLKPVPATVWLGLVFVNLGGEGSSFDAVTARVRAAWPGIDEESLTASPIGSVQRIVHAPLAAVAAAFDPGAAQGTGSGDGEMLARVMPGRNILIGRVPGLFCSMVIEPRPRAGCVLALRYYRVGDALAAPGLRQWGRYLARTIAALEHARPAPADPPGVVPGRA